MAALLSDSKDFCGDGSHFASLSTSDFAGGATRLQRFRAHGEAPEEERELETFTPVADEVELIRKRRPRSRFPMNKEAVQMFATPAECILKDFVEFGETGCADHEQSPPHQRTHAAEHYAKLIDRNGRYRRFRYANSLSSASLPLNLMTPGISRSPKTPIISTELENMMFQGFQPDSLLRILSAFLAFAGVTTLDPSGSDRFGPWSRILRNLRERRPADNPGATVADRPRTLVDCLPTRSESPGRYQMCRLLCHQPC